MKNSIFLNAFKGPQQQIPVWFMRQAGRFLPEYRAIRQHHTLDEMFRDPKIIAEVTCQPVSILKVDAAILFADILTLPMAMGFEITFDPQHGPIIKNKFTSETDFKSYHAFDGAGHIEQAIPLINAILADEIPLIGFAGAPFTVLCYLVEGGSSTNYKNVFKLMYQNPQVFHRLMDLLTTNTIAYLSMQKKAGIHVFQLFDSWGGILRYSDYEQHNLPYLQKIFEAIDLPSIYFLKNCQHLLPLMEQAGSDFLSVCETVSIANDSFLKKTNKGIQGNLFNALLYADLPVIEKEVQSLLAAGRQHGKYIFNLSHGIQPDVNPQVVKQIVEMVHRGNI